jgi:hypothetical protein
MKEREMPVLKKFLAQLPLGEQEDFKATCAERGLRRDAFEVQMQEEYPAAEEDLGIIRREALIVRISNGRRKNYRAGAGKAWTVAFQIDLLSGYYD